MLSMLLCAAILGPLPTARAASTFTLLSLDAQVNGGDVTASTTVVANPEVTANRYGVCVRLGTTNVDFQYATNIVVTKSGTEFSDTKSFTPGTYTYAACVQVGRTWYGVGAAKTFVVGGAPLAAAPTASMMPVGDLPGWRQIFAEDFASTVARGSFARSGYSDRMYSYEGFNDTSGHGRYNTGAVLSVSDNALDYYLHTANGQHNVSALVPEVPATGWGQTYGRYSVRFRSDVLPGYKMAFLLWPDSDNWADGEVDFPEVGSLEPGNNIYANLYSTGNTSTGKPGPSNGFKTAISAAGSGWHTATIEWSPGQMTYILDGAALGTLRSGVPNTRMHMVLQVETSSGAAPANSVAGHFQVDWVTMYSYSP